MTTTIHVARNPMLTSSTYWTASCDGCKVTYNGQGSAPAERGKLIFNLTKDGWYVADGDCEKTVCPKCRTIFAQIRGFYPSPLNDRSENT